MPTLEGLRKAVELNQLISKPSEDASANLYKMGKDMGQFFTAQKAGQQYQAGDTQGAMASLMSNPAFAGQVAGNLPNTDPNLANSMEGSKLDALHDYNSTPGDVAAIKARASQDKGALTLDPTMGYKVQTKGGTPTGMIMRNGRLEPAPGLQDPQQAFQKGLQDSAVSSLSGQPDQSIPIPASQAQSNQSNPATPSAPQAQPQQAPKLAPDEAIDSNGQKVRINPNQNKALTKATSDFNKEAKPYVDAINQTTGSEKLLDLNFPGAQLAEKIKTVKGLYGGGRIPQDLVKQYGNGTDAGFLTFLNDSITKAEGNALSPQARQNMYNLNIALQKDAVTQYDSLLKARSAQIGSNAGVDPFIVKQRLGATGPTDYQQTIGKLQQQEPDVQALYNWAHDNIGSADPATRSKAKQYMDALGQKYGLH